MSASDPRIGTYLDEYRIEGLIGRGGMGMVYLAEHTHLGKRVALKVLPPEYAQDVAFRDRFDREARLAASLDHPNIVPVYDAGEADGELWIAMRFVDGLDLGEIIVRDGPMDAARAISILGRVASALDAAHARGLVHRDVKPGNVLVEPAKEDRPEHVYLTDFGLTKRVDVEGKDASMPRGRPLTRAGLFVGTIEYAAPEQFKGGQLDGRIDEYALGCVLYETLTGSVPFRGDSEAALMFAHLTEEPPRVTASRPDLPPMLGRVIAQAMAKDPNQRFQKCGAMIAAARAVLGVHATHVSEMMPMPAQMAPGSFPSAVRPTPPPPPFPGVPEPSQASESLPGMPARPPAPPPEDRGRWRRPRQ